MALPITRGKTLSVFSLVMINIIAVDSLRTLPVSAEYGFSLIFFFIVAGLIFFIPVSLVAAELATGWPQTGGLYVWVKEAFGKTAGFMVIWLQWVYNIVWYPTILSFISSAFAYLIDPQQATSPAYLFFSTVTIFWLTTLANLYGMRVSSLISAFGAIIGTLVPMFFIIGLAIYWYFSGYPIAITPSWQNFFPKSTDLSSLVFFTGILFGLVGMEMSAVHAGDVKNPQRDYPKALLYSTMIIFTTLMFGSLAVAMVVPHEKLSLVTGFIDAFSAFFSALHIEWMLPFTVLMVIIGGISSVSAWVLGPSKGLMVSAEDDCLPKVFFKVNRYGAPSVILITQAVLFTLLSSLFFLNKNINHTYWMFSALTEQLAMAVYILMFLAAIYLRVKKSEVKRAFTIPGSNMVLFMVAGLGIFSCSIAIALGFIPPSDLPLTLEEKQFFKVFIKYGLLFLVVIPLLYVSWRQRKK